MFKLLEFEFDSQFQIYNLKLSIIFIDVINLYAII